MSEGSSKSSSFHHQGLPDDLLIDILCRLPCESIFLLKCVSKHWHALISDPKFIICLIEHKIRRNPEKTSTTTKAKRWTLLQTKETNIIKGVTCRSPELPLISVFTGLDFLPFRHVTIAATFKDLILCYNINQLNSQREYHIANPVTKQWLSLPPSPLLPFQRDRSWDALICEEAYRYDEDKGSVIGLNLGYRFRVVLVHPFPEEEDGVKYDPFGNFNLVVFCSETWKWKHVLLVVPTSDVDAHDVDECDIHYQRRAGFEGLVCKRILYLRHNLTFGAFDPFNVTDSSNNNSALLVLATSSLPLPCYGWGSLCVFNGSMLYLGLHRQEYLGIYELKSKKKRYPIRWRVEGRFFLPIPGIKPSYPFKVLGFEMMNRELVYLIVTVGDQVLLSDMRSRATKSRYLCIPGYHISAFTFEPQYWPTPIPTNVSVK